MLDLTGEAGERERGNGGCLLPTPPFQKAPGVWAGLSKLGSAKTVPAEGLRLEGDAGTAGQVLQVPP